MTREITYQKEFRDTVSNWKKNRLPAAILILGLMMVMLGAVIKPLGVLAVVGFGIVKELYIITFRDGYSTTNVIERIKNET